MHSLREHRILVIIPAFNEEFNLDAVIAGLKANCAGFDILVVNDGSRDNTKQCAAKNRVIVLNHAFNAGIGVSFQTGCQFALKNDYDYIVRIDADGQHDPTFIKDVVSPLLNNDADIVIGSRFLGKSAYKSSFLRLIGIALISFILTLISKKKVTDPTSGFCAMNRKAYEFFAKNCSEDYPEPKIFIHHDLFKIKEIPISMNKRNYGASTITFSNSTYYMLKVIFSLFIGSLKKERFRYGDIN